MRKTPCSENNRVTPVTRNAAYAIADASGTAELPPLPTVTPITVLDDGLKLEIPFDALLLYHGRDSIGGLALGFRLLEFAFKHLTPNAPPERREITFETGFPGPGLRDAVEMVTRAVTRGAFTVDEHPPATAPEGVYGRMIFTVGVGTKRITLQLVEGALPTEFITVGRAVKAGGADDALNARWRALKEALALAVLSAPDDALFELITKP